MENSILISTKKMLGISEDYEAFDQDVLTCINSAFFTLNQLGVGPKAGFVIDDDTAVWEDFMGSSSQLSAIKTYLFLKVRMLFDPPATSFAIEAMNSQIKEHEWRLNTDRESNVIGSITNRDCEVA